MTMQIVTAARIEGWQYEQWWHIQRTSPLHPQEAVLLEEGNYIIVNETVLGWGMYTSNGEMVTANAILESPAGLEYARHYLARISDELGNRESDDISSIGSFLISIRAQDWQWSPIVRARIAAAQRIDYRDFFYLDRITMLESNGTMDKDDLDGICSHGFYVVTNNMLQIPIRDPVGENVLANAILADSRLTHPPAKLPFLFLARLLG